MLGHSLTIYMPDMHAIPDLIAGHVGGGEGHTVALSLRVMDAVAVSLRVRVRLRFIFESLIRG